MLQPGRIPLLLLTAFLIAMGYTWWVIQPRFPINRPASELVLQQADLHDSFLLHQQETEAILTNPYEELTEHFRSGFRAVFVGAVDSEWQGSRLVSTTFVVDGEGAEKVFKAYVAQTRNRGEVLSLPPLGEQSLFVVARNEASAPVVVIGTVRVQNILITLTLMTDVNHDPVLVHKWAKMLVERILPR